MKTPFFLLICFILLSCSVSESEKSLEVAENIIEFRPDSALSIIRKTDASELASRRLKAKHAVLNAMALDKCYIDITSDSIIAPALEYYKRHGSAEYKLKANYYRGVIARNADDWDTAMTYYVMAERFADKCKDKKAVARLHNAKMHVYRRLYQYEKAISEGRESADLYYHINDTSSFVNTLLDVGVAYKGLEKLDKVIDIIKELAPYKSHFTVRQLSRYYLLFLQLEGKHESKLVENSLKEYLTIIEDSRHINWVSVASAYMRCGNLEAAKEAIEKALAKSQNEYTHVKYKIAAKIYTQIGNYKNAASSYEAYVAASDSIDINIYKSDAEHVEEKYLAENEILKKKLAVTFLSLSSIILILIASFVFHILYIRFRRMHDEKIRFEEMYNSLINERNILKRTKKETKMDKDVFRLVEERLYVLNRFVVAHITKNFSKEASEKLKELIEDREYFLESTRVSFAISHPRFLKFLATQGLNNWEIGFCCMYCIGLNGHEIGEYLKRKAHYKMNGKIRDKLKLDRSTSLKTYLLKKMDEFNQ